MSLTHGGQDVPQVVFADDPVSVLVDDCESLRQRRVLLTLVNMRWPSAEGATSGRLSLDHSCPISSDSPITAGELKTDLLSAVVDVSHHHVSLFLIRHLRNPKKIPPAGCFTA